MVGQRFSRWSVVFSTMVGGRCSIQYLVGGRWQKVGGRWSVVGGWSVGDGFVLRPILKQDVVVKEADDSTKKQFSSSLQGYFSHH